MTIGERIGAYATRYWLKNSMQKWPTVRETCKALKIRHVDVEENAEGNYITTSWFVYGGESFGYHFIEADNPQVEQAWCKYWLEYSPCTCGTHT